MDQLRAERLARFTVADSTKQGDEGIAANKSWEPFRKNILKPFDFYRYILHRRSNRQSIGLKDATHSLPPRVTSIFRRISYPFTDLRIIEKDSIGSLSESSRTSIS